MRIAQRLRLAVLGGIAATAAASVLPSAASASPVHPVAGPAPIPVYQIPAVGIAVSGLVVPGPYTGTVLAQTGNVPGETTFSAPFTPSVCSASAGGALVRISYLNVASGENGSVVVKPCVNFLEPAPHQATVRTGSGLVLVTVSVTGSRFYPNAGQPSLPGAGGFMAP